MITNKNYILREIAGETILVPTGKETERLNGMISLSEAGAFLWKHAEEAGSVEKLIEMMLEEYDAEEEVIRRDVISFMSEMILRGLISDVPDLKIDLPDGKPVDFDTKMRIESE